MNKDEKVAVAIVLACLTPAAFACADYVRVIRTERSKRRKIENWKQNSIRLIEETEERSLNLINDTKRPVGEVLEEIAVQQNFLNYVIEETKPWK